MKTMINSSYGSGLSILTTYDEISLIKRKIMVIELRKYKINKICQIGK